MTSRDGRQSAGGLLPPCLSVASISVSANSVPLTQGTICESGTTGIDQQIETHHNGAPSQLGHFWWLLPCHGQWPHDSPGVTGVISKNDAETSEWGRNTHSLIRPEGHLMFPTSKFFAPNRLSTYMHFWAGPPAVSMSHQETIRPNAPQHPHHWNTTTGHIASLQGGTTYI